MNIVDSSSWKALVYSTCLATQPVQQKFQDLFDDDDFNRQDELVIAYAI